MSATHELKNSVVGKYVRECHREEPARTEHCFSILKKCQSKFDCLLYEMLFIRELKPKLNTLEFNILEFN